MNKINRNTMTLILSLGIIAGCSATRPSVEVSETTKEIVYETTEQSSTFVTEKATSEDSTAVETASYDDIDETEEISESESSLVDPLTYLVEIMDLYDECLKIADDEQREKLLSMTNDGDGDEPPSRLRDIKRIMGFMSDDDPRLTLEDAVRICNEVYPEKPDDGVEALKMEDTLVKLFNEIAGIQDIDGGSGIRHIMYYLDNEHTEWIYIQYGSVQYYNETEGRGIIILDWILDRPAGTVIEYRP